MSEEKEIIERSIWHGLEKAVNKFVKKLSRDFDIPPPSFVFVEKPENLKKICGVDASGCYVHPSSVIYISDNSAILGVSTLLHEFSHHLQYIRAGKDGEKAFPSQEHSKPHCERRHEHEAKEFAEFYEKSYATLYEKSLHNIMSLYSTCLIPCASLIIDNKPILEKLIEGASDEELINTAEELERKDLISRDEKEALFNCIYTHFKKFPCKDVLEMKDYLEELKRILEQLE